MDTTTSAATSTKGDRASKLTQQNDTRYQRLRQDRPAVIKATFTLRQIMADCGCTVLDRDGVKFKSPLRPDQHPSCSIRGEHMTDWSSGSKRYDLIDFYAEYWGISVGQAISELYVRAAGRHAMDSLVNRAFRSNVVTQDGSTSHRSPDDELIAEKRLKRKKWQADLQPLGERESDVLALIRNVSPEAVANANRTGMLFQMGSGSLTSWVLTNSRKTNAQARLLSGKGWPLFNGNIKAKTLPGSWASDPIYGELKDRHALALVEGGPDWLAFWHLAHIAGVEDWVMPVAMFGSSLSIPEFDLAQFAGRRVRIFVHADDSGHRAAMRWSEQLDSVKCLVDGFDFSGLVQTGGAPVKDLNDVTRIDADSWEDNRDLIENIVSFAIPQVS